MRIYISRVIDPFGSREQAERCGHQPVVAYMLALYVTDRATACLYANPMCQRCVDLEYSYCLQAEIKYPD